MFGVAVRHGIHISRGRTRETGEQNERACLRERQEVRAVPQLRHVLHGAGVKGRGETMWLRDRETARWISYTYLQKESATIMYTSKEQCVRRQGRPKLSASMRNEKGEKQDITRGQCCENLTTLQFNGYTVAFAKGLGSKQKAAGPCVWRSAPVSVDLVRWLMRIAMSLWHLSRNPEVNRTWSARSRKTGFVVFKPPSAFWYCSPRIPSSFPYDQGNRFCPW